MNKKEIRSYNCLIIDEKDNVVTALKTLSKGEEAIFEKNGEAVCIIVQNDIPFGHKLSLKDIKKGDHIIKYGEIIGGAIVDIKNGEYVHVHNLESLRARGDKR